MYYTSLAAAKLWFGSCPTRSWQLGSRQNRVWQLAKSGLAAGQPSHWGFAATERPIINEGLSQWISPPRPPQFFCLLIYLEPADI